MSIRTREFAESEAADYLITPRAGDDKYTHGVVGFVTGSEQYPGAAVLGVSAALHTGVGMVRFLSEAAPTELVLQRHPEVVCRDGRAHAWVLGSGVDPGQRSDETAERMLTALASNAVCVLDAGALDLVNRVTGMAVITPHAQELSRLFAEAGVEVSAPQLVDEPARWSAEAADRWGVCVLLKGHNTVIAAPGESSVFLPPSGSEWLATAGTGDVLAGALGAIVATVAARYEADGVEFTISTVAACAATAAVLHAKASRSISAPFTTLELADALGSARRALEVTGR